MADRPILFSGPMVAALLSGRKTQTRRIVKPQPQLPIEMMEGGWWDDGHDHDIRCPYGRPGDRLWVREMWALVPASAYRCSEGVQQIVNPSDPDMAAVYAAGWDRSRPGRWRPSIHMPRWASRITLEITGVRCERLQDISEADAVAEGMARVTKDGSLYKYGIPDRDGLPGNDDHGWHWQEWERDPRNAYHKLWEQINGPGSAVANPWVWAITFKRVENTNA